MFFSYKFLSISVIESGAVSIFKRCIIFAYTWKHQEYINQLKLLDIVIYYIVIYFYVLTLYSFIKMQIA